METKQLETKQMKNNLFNLLKLFALCVLCFAVAFFFVGCAKETQSQVQKVYIATPTKCDYVLPSVDINTTNYAEIARSTAEIIEAYKKLKSDLAKMPCVNLD